MRPIGMAISAALALSLPAASGEDAVRFAPLKAEELSPQQKAWADMISTPPRNAKFTAPPYRAYIRNPDLAPKLSNLLGISALEHLAAGAAQRDGDPDHGAALDRAI